MCNDSYQFTVVACPLLPIGHGSLIQLKSMHNALNRATPRQQRYHSHKEFFRLTDSFQCCPSPLIKCLLAYITSISTSAGIMNDYVPLPYLPRFPDTLRSGNILGRHPVFACHLHVFFSLMQYSTRDASFTILLRPSDTTSCGSTEVQ